MRIVVILTGLLLLSGCYHAPDPIKPMSWLFKQMPDDAPNMYKRGWKDGCESGLGSMTSTAYKTFYSFKQDSGLRKNPLYYKTWKDTYTFCRHYAYGTLRQANVRMRQPNERTQLLQRFMGTESIFEAGLLQLWGPGDDGLMPFGKVGTIGGNLGDSIGMGGAMDFSDDAVMNGKGKNPIMNWDFNN